jgi:murein DD-endopeptidase MepM/ murein hydrolase activator NlpD
MYDGEVTMIRNSFNPGQYLANSYGNFIIIKSTIDNETISIRYNHLNNVNVKKGDIVTANRVIGFNGNTGNAADPDVTPHIHIQAYSSSGISINPQDFLTTKFNSDYEAITNNCN